ncbi:response regulator [Roseateles chitinivorans]|uniref:response regulator n=1 Tax=Roseateles chitinivorans TaxID=2917965 RepID=UPI003D67A20F
MKILLADPSPAFRKMLYERLREVPTATVVAQASDEDQAVFLAALCAPDLVLTELDLGRGCGLSLMERLRAAGYEGIAYMVTSADEAEYGPRCVEAGITGFYDKTYDMERLLQAMTVLAQAPVTFGQSRIRASAV